jgi:hypothetical protein
MHKDVFRLTVLLACAALATSRLGLIGHELVGHGGAALLCGARINDVQLFWFAGGWIRYRLPEPSFGSALFITMAGIGLELVVGLGLAIFARGATLGRRIGRGVGMALVLHATWYLATGAFHGFGDGLLLYRWLGSARVPVAIAAGLMTCTATFLGAREVVGTLASTVSRRVVGTLVACVLAGGFHAALTIGELRVRRDPTYVETMKPERERVIAQELATWEKAQPTPVTREAKRVEATKIARAHPTFPFVWILALCTALAGFFGIVKTKRPPPQAIPNGLLLRFVVLAVASVGLVIAISTLG